MESSTISAPRVGFFVVGSARSGTTLVQRLACEIAGVGMPPETHFFSSFVTGLLDRRSFPLAEPAIREEMANFSALESSEGLVIDPDMVVEDLGGTVRSPYGLFEAVVRTLVGPTQILGEKTPGHLLWWPAIVRASPDVRFVVIVRDPRAMVASNLSMPWTTNEDLAAFGSRLDLGLAARWKVDQQAVTDLATTVGARGCLVLRHEDVVADPDSARQKIASLIGVDSNAALQSAPAEIVLPWERWKLSALEEVTSDRLRSWERALTAIQAKQIAAICSNGMRRYGYLQTKIGPLRAAIVKSRMDPGIRYHLERFQEIYTEYQRYIATVAL